MGGLISLYAFFRRRRCSGAAGAMSPALWFGQGAASTTSRRHGLRQDACTSMSERRRGPGRCGMRAAPAVCS